MAPEGNTIDDSKLAEAIRLMFERSGIDSSAFFGAWGEDVDDTFGDEEGKTLALEMANNLARILGAEGYCISSMGVWTPEEIADQKRRAKALHDQLQAFIE